MTPYYQDGAIRVYHADVTAGIPLPDGSVQCVVTSPPYWGLRDYGTAMWEGGDVGHAHDRVAARNGRGGSGSPGKQTTDAYPSTFPASECSCGARRIDAQLGLEKTPEEYVARMVAVFREVRRVLRDDGTLWLNMGDSYAATSGPNTSVKNTGQQAVLESGAMRLVSQTPPPGLKPKDLVGIPWRLAFALQADGWYLRSEIIWAKPNAMPESVTDRPTKSHEQIFLLTKKPTYFYDSEAVREDGPTYTRKAGGYHGRDGHNASRFAGRGGFGDSDVTTTGRNLRSVWTIATAPFSGAHFATFPPDLAARCILAGTSEKGACPACGAPWARVVERTTWPTRPGTETKGNGDRNDAGNPYRPETVSTTLGWRPTCACQPPDVDRLHWEKLSFDERRRYWHVRPWPATDTRPCVVLDPFAGALTTLHVAKELGRHAVGVELNAAYIDLGVPRCAQDVLPL